MSRGIPTLGAFALHFVFATGLAGGCARQSSAEPRAPAQSQISSDLSGEIEPAVEQEWEHWALRLGEASGSMQTRFRHSWDRWRIDYGTTQVDIDTRFSNSWDKWRIQGGGVRINADTRFSKSWDKWMLETIDGHLQVSRAAGGPDRWLIEGAGGRITLVASQAHSTWRVRDEMPNATPSSKLAAIFLVVQNGTLRDKVALPPPAAAAH